MGSEVIGKEITARWDGGPPVDASAFSIVDDSVEGSFVMIEFQVRFGTTDE